MSRVINNKPGIKLETRQRVQELLKKYNYIPDAAARGLVMQSSRLVGILIVDTPVVLSLIHISSPRDTERSRMPSSA